MSLSDAAHTAPFTTPIAIAADHTSAAPVVRLTDIHKRFGQQDVLKGVRLEVGAGEVAALIGSSGSGKSTLLRCVNLLEIPDAGEIEVSGERVVFIKDRQGRRQPKDRRQMERIRQTCGMVFQSFNLWTHMTALENVIEAPMHVLGRSRAEATEKAEVLLEKVGLAAKRHAYPAEMSGGQQQRAAIARMLAMEPKAMLFDEPTSALDPELVGEVLKVMGNLAAEGATMLIVTHEMSFARDIADKVAFLHEGRVEEEGSPQQVFGAPSSERCRQFLAHGFGRVQPA
jgi:octopine/nopaline transport system ATP-binding protein